MGIKIAAFLLLLEGRRPGWTAQVLGVTRQSLNLWMHQLNERGLGSLEPIRRPGRPSRVTASVSRQLKRHLEKTPADFGFRRARWDGPTLAVHLKRRFKITLKVRQAQTWIRRLGHGRKGQGCISPGKEKKCPG